MGVVTVRNIAIGQGIPKICIPIVAPAREGILKEAKSLLSLPCDLVEWRCDWYEDIFAEGTGRILADLREILGDKPILCTFRTKEEGGARNASPAQYHSLICQMIEEAASDLVDLELFSLSGSLKQLTALAREKGVKTIVSSHDFSRTPPSEEMLNRLLQMEEGGADIAKLAVMPERPEDVLELLSVTCRFSDGAGHIPLITMSMGELGCVSRLCGRIFGSAVTFGSAGCASAPGQISAEELSRILQIL